MLSLHRISIAIALCGAIVALMPAKAVAQSSPQPAASQSAAPLKPEQLEQLAAPIALYPDPLLAQVLMAATYPLEVVAAERWVTANKNLKPEELKAQAEKKGWDKSVVALVATPEVLKMMSDKLDWTQQIGDALLAQQADLMDAVQRLRTKAKAQNKLATTKQQKSFPPSRSKARKSSSSSRPSRRRSTCRITIPQSYTARGRIAAYPPYFFPWPGYIARGIIAAGIAFGAGYALGRWTSGGNYWGGSFNWGNNNININRPININNARVNSFRAQPGAPAWREVSARTCSRNSPIVPAVTPTSASISAVAMASKSSGRIRAAPAAIVLAATGPTPGVLAATGQAVIGLERVSAPAAVTARGRPTSRRRRPAAAGQRPAAATVRGRPAPGGRPPASRSTSGRPARRWRRRLRRY